MQRQRRQTGTDKRDDCRQRTEGNETEHEKQEFAIAVDDGIHHLHTTDFQSRELRCHAGENVTGAVFREIAQGHAFEHLAHADAFFCGNFCADAFLEHGTAIPQQKAEHDAACETGQ